jgi:hypothetical protein
MHAPGGVPEMTAEITVTRLLFRVRQAEVSLALQRWKGVP